MKLKICGITSLEDALDAAALEADALGFIFAKSPRQVSIETCKKICDQLPPFITRVGVFVDDDIDQVNHILETCGLDIAQLHGKESVSYCQQIKRRIIKAFRMHQTESLELLPPYEETVHSFLLDSYVPGKPGGTGQVFDWGLAVQAKKITKRPIILSGGLKIENIRKAIQTVHPDAIDISSGVESEPGKKDYQKLAQVCQLVKEI